MNTKCENFLLFFSGTLIGLFSQVRNGGDIVRDRALKFLHMKIKTSGSELLSSKETEAVLLEEIKHSIEECTADEFHMFMAMLAATSLQKSIGYIDMGLIYLKITFDTAFMHMYCKIKIYLVKK